MIVRFFAMLCAGLLLANVMMFFWPSAVIDESAYVEKSRINPQYIRLNKEIEEKADSNKLTAQVGVEAEDVCYRLGPFMQRSNYELAQAILFNVNIKFEKSERISQKSKAYRVFLGTFDSKPKVLAARKELQDKKVLDHFIRKLPDQEYLISLGIYTTEASADRAFIELQKDIDGLKIQQEMVVLPESYWLHFSLNESQPEFSQLKQLDWGERSAKLGKHECKTPEVSEG